MEPDYATPAFAQAPDRTNMDGVPTFITKDGSAIRELLHPSSSSVVHQSLAEAIVEPGQTTELHLHHVSEELYHITHGEGLMTLGNQAFVVRPGDSIVIKPATPHCIQNLGEVQLKILCCSAPAYSHEDTDLL